MATQTSLRPGEIKDILLREIEAADLNSLDVEEVGTVLEVKDGVARIYGLQKAMARAVKPLLRYRCAACGFEATQHFWQCPGCQAWDSYPARRVEEL